MAYLTRRIERVAMLQLEAMSDRQLEDIGLTRSQIEWAVRGERRSSISGPVTGRGDQMDRLLALRKLHLPRRSCRQSRYREPIAKERGAGNCMPYLREPGE